MKIKGVKEVNSFSKFYVFWHVVPSIRVVVEYIATQECLMQLRSVYQAAQRASVVASENIMESVLLIYYWDRKNTLTQCTSCYPL